MAILTAVAAVALVIVDSGFSQTLIRKQAPEQHDFKSVFLFNVGVSAVLYFVFVAASPVAARFYDMPELVPLAPVFFLLLPVNALCTVQNVLFTRQFRFALLSKVTFVSWMVSGLVAIGMALSGYGVWSIVAQRVLQMAVRAGLLWWISDWRPYGKCSLDALRRMAPYSFSLMTTELVTTFYNKIPQFFIGRLYPVGVLGAFDQAVKLKDQLVTSAVQSVQNVTFPALTRIGDDACRFAESYRQIVMLVAYVLFPVMMGLSAIAPDLFATLLGAKWMSAVPYLEVICLVGLFYPVAMVAFTVLKVRSDGGIILRIELIKKGLMTAVFVATIPVGVQAVVWGLVVIAFCEMAVNVGASMRFTVLRIGRLVRTLLPIAAVTAAMYGAVAGCFAFPAFRRCVATDDRNRCRRRRLCVAFGDVPVRSIPRNRRFGSAAILAIGSVVLLDDVNLLVASLHPESFPSVLFQIIVVLQLFDQRAVLFDFLRIMCFFPFQSADFALDANGMQQIAAHDESREKQDDPRNDHPSFLTDTNLHD